MPGSTVPAHCAASMVLAHRRLQQATWRQCRSAVCMVAAAWWAAAAWPGGRAGCCLAPVWAATQLQHSFSVAGASLFPCAPQHSQQLGARGLGRTYAAALGWECGAAARQPCRQHTTSQQESARLVGSDTQSGSLWTAACAQTAASRRTSVTCTHKLHFVGVLSVGPQALPSYSVPLFVAVGVLAMDGFERL